MMMMPPSSIRILFAVVFVVGVVFGALLRPFISLASLKPATVAHEDAERAEYVLTTATWINKLYEVCQLEEEAREKRFRSLLVGELYDLAMSENLIDAEIPDAFVHHGANAVNHLNANDFSDVQAIAAETGHLYYVTEPFLDPDHENHDVVKSFVERAFAFQWPPDTLTEPRD